MYTYIVILLDFIRIYYCIWTSCLVLGFGFQVCFFLQIDGANNFCANYLLDSERIITLV